MGMFDNTSRYVASPEAAHKQQACLNADKRTWLAGRAGTQQVSCHFKQQRNKIKHIAGSHYSVLRQPNNEQ